MVSLDDAVVARLARFGTTFEVLVDPDGVEALMEKEAPSPQDVSDVLAVDDVFVDWSEGDRASEEQLQEGFETTDRVAVARRILEDGDVQLTTEQRKKMLASKRNRILESIARNAWNPQAKAPHPKERIERALDEAKFRVDPLKRVAAQVKEAVAVLKPMLPISFERVKVAIKIPPEHTGQAAHHIHQLGDVEREEWLNDGSMVAVLEIPAGAQGEVYDRLNSVTHGTVETRILD